MTTIITFPACCALFAVDLNGLLSILFILFTLIVYVINQVTAKGQEAARKNQPRPRPAPPQHDPTEDEIEAFLRRASRKRAEGEGGPRSQPSQPQRQTFSGPASSGPSSRDAASRGPMPGASPLPSQQRQGQRRGAHAPPTRPSQPIPGQIVSGANPAAPQGRTLAPASGEATPTSLSEQLEHRTGFSSFDTAGTKFPTLHSSLEQVDEAVEARLHSTFDHALGSLGTGLLTSSDDDRTYGSTVSDSSTPQASRPVSGGSIVDMLRSPQGIRDAIVMQEILRPRSLD